MSSSNNSSPNVESNIFQATEATFQQMNNNSAGQMTFNNRQSNKDVKYVECSLVIRRNVEKMKKHSIKNTVIHLKPMIQ
jgi:hypothetical protein